MSRQVRISLTLLVCLFAYGVQGQTPDLSLSHYEDSLKNLGHTITNDTLEHNRIQANYTFIRTLTSALKHKGSFNYPFSLLNSVISAKYSEDKKFRIFTWFVYLDDGTFRYYGAIQLNNPEKLELIPLIDGTPEIEHEELATLAANNWFGAVYYDIISVANGKNPYYVLLGWKGKDHKVTSKVFEILQFKGKTATFGLPTIQREPKSNSFLHRKVFNFSSAASMLLRYNRNDKLFVFDHLVPIDPKLASDRSQYIPDLTYDGYRFRNGKWIYVESINLKNLPDEKDNLYVDPTKVNSGTTPIRQY
ncbi:hypothetical protein EIM50_20650 [Pseudoxanthomonas sp. SGD-10]|nr:hypothetical protein EIM50_20650 [Pseudoxanthomonas sp. SGD-10]